MKPNKYRAKRTECGGGHIHASKKEARRCGELSLLEKAGEIHALVQQPESELKVNGVSIGKYRADFAYIENGKMIVEDCKGFKTPEYKLKKKLMLALWGIEIKET